ncbi:hypothetical protein NIES2119_27880 [[Phormidium ambiguum] IAM M-71]|uniref:Uncharacterized protein n=1 Tax=[Phormidium ambiguum] IAM M-71 TaxID=454136 RepID=A0A1U7I679_9CYAN|nr:hypothetical protein [Phormidium ambiguum]OKH31791.1 hypothetical protein NIES2119_27880 [Phormidium ambiguum IAM M-71]
MLSTNNTSLNAQLNASERARLDELETAIDRGLQTFYEVGKALEEIREQKLYRETHKTFEAYCRDRWGIARPTAYRFINAAQVMENLSPIGDILPRKENQVRPLTQLSPELQIEIWQQAVELASNGIPTGAAVQRLVDEKLSSPNPKRNSPGNHSEIEQLRQENQRLREQIRRQNIEREKRSAEVAAELERLREENRQLKAELRQRDIDWERRLAYEREKIRAEVRAELKAEYEGIINSLTAQVKELTRQLEEIRLQIKA